MRLPLEQVPSPALSLLSAESSKTRVTSLSAVCPQAPAITSTDVPLGATTSTWRVPGTGWVSPGSTTSTSVTSRGGPPTWTGNGYGAAGPRPSVLDGPG